MPAGHIEVGESAVAALIRVARDAIGISIDRHEVELTHVMHDSAAGGRVAFFFSVRRWAGVPENRKLDTCSGPRWFPLDDLPDHLIGYCREALECIGLDHCFSTYGW